MPKPLVAADLSIAMTRYAIAVMSLAVCWCASSACLWPLDPGRVFSRPEELALAKASNW